MDGQINQYMERYIHVQIDIPMNGQMCIVESSIIDIHIHVHVPSMDQSQGVDYISKVSL